MSQDAPTDLPKLNPLIILAQGPAKTDGSPTWTLHNPVSNEYFRLDWAEFECLARFSHYETIDALISAVNDETTLEIDESDVKNLLLFLNEKGLLTLGQQAIAPKAKTKQPLWKKILHGYLFFTLPLVKPEAFLRKTLPFVRPLLSRRVVIPMLIVLVLGILITLQRADEFFNTFTHLFSVQGVIMGLLVFAGLKIIHELAHAYTATKYGVRVPHMGVAFIIMYPVLYTETTGSWQLSSRRERLHIGMAGILAELCLAGVFLWLWHLAPAGSILQSLCFSAVAISLIGSLLVNLNPLMRFDGYYMLSDALGLENLQGRACAFARWELRRALFALDDPAPEDLPTRQKTFLTRFGFALLVYRFFLFLGIAVLVYHVFPKPLGAFLMCVELLWFIGLPIWSELKIWNARHVELLKTKRTHITLAASFIFMLALILPWKNTITAPAIVHASNHTSIYPPSDAFIEKIMVREGEPVQTEQVIAILSSNTLEKKYRKTMQELRALEDYRRRVQSSPDQARSAMASIDSEISLKEQTLANLAAQKERLIVKAPFEGQVRDISPEIHAGRSIKKTDLLLRVIDSTDKNVTAYIDEQNLKRIQTGNRAVFRPANAAFTKISLQLEKIEQTSVQTLPWPELSSVYGGPIPSTTDQGSATPSEGIEVLQGLFSLRLNMAKKDTQDTDIKDEYVKTGTVRIQGTSESILSKGLRNALGLFIRESGLN